MVIVSIEPEATGLLPYLDKFSTDENIHNFQIHFWDLDFYALKTQKYEFKIHCKIYQHSFSPRFFKPIKLQDNWLGIVSEQIDGLLWFCLCWYGVNSEHHIGCD